MVCNVPAGLGPEDIDAESAHGTSTKAGDSTEAECLREVFGAHLPKIPISANQSQIGHSLGAAAALADLDVVPDTARLAHEFVLSNVFGGINCCVVLRGI